MSTILHQIVERKKSDLITEKKILDLETLKLSIVNKQKTSEVSFYNSFDKSRPHYILECKKASPSRGVIRHKFIPTDIAKVYNRYATAISVLTDEPYFQGSFEYLKQVREVSRLPLLCKDFIIDEYQIYKARSYGADAILLILEILTDEEYIELSRVAHDLNMGVLTEVVNEDQAKRSNALGAKVVGVNNRNLKDFSIDHDRYLKLASLIDSNSIMISESGISQFSQISHQLMTVDGFLIGSALMKEDDLDLACRSLMFGANKLCGVKSQEIADTAFENGFTYIGYNFVEKSPRFISAQDAKEIKTSLLKVGVFQNQSIEEVSQIVTTCKLNAIQLHGNEDEKYIQDLKVLLSEKNVKLWKALSVHNFEQSKVLDVDLFVLDSKNHKSFGGTGEVFDWSLIADLPKDKILLAGGIGEENVEEALKLGVMGLDLNSKLEDKNQNKSVLKIKSIFQKIMRFKNKEM